MEAGNSAYIQSLVLNIWCLMKLIIIHCNGSWKQSLHTVIAFEYMVFDENDHYSLQCQRGGAGGGSRWSGLSGSQIGTPEAIYLSRGKQLAEKQQPFQ